MKGFNKELVDKLGNFVKKKFCKWIYETWHNIINNHCLETEKILDSSGAVCLKLFDHCNVVATRCNQQEEHINSIKDDVSIITQVAKTTQPAVGSSPTLELLRKDLHNYN